MANTAGYRYEPDQVSPPGETLEELLDERGISQAELAERTGRSKKHINEIIQGKAPISAETALQFELVLGVPARFWLQREQYYREWLARQEEAANLAKMVEWLKQVPINEMAKLGWIERYKEPVAQLRAVLQFFAIAAPEQWEAGVAAFRKSPAFVGDPIALSAWLRQGEREAHQIACASFDEPAFRAVLGRIRTLTTEPPEHFRPLVLEWCAAVGVAVVFVPELRHTHVSGATRWLSPSKAMIQLSMRYKTDDHLWFTFFHEAGHILLHGKRDVFLEGTQTDDVKEHEANRFAEDMLIPPNAFAAFTDGNAYRSKAAIIAFAQQIGIAPGIVVGRLQHAQKLPRRNCNELKRRFEWVP